MSYADIIYNDLIKEILDTGISDENEKVRTIWNDGTPAHTIGIISKQIKFNNTEVPIITSKHVAWKSAIKEMLWIWQMKSNKVQDLRNMGVKIWNEWELKDGTIGKAYGYQLGQKCRIINNDVLDQVDYLIWSLKNNPSSRRHITTLWDKDDLDKMALQPCVWNTQWIVKQNKLHLIVGIRSNDLALGHPFNVFQYYVLQRMIAQVTNYELGTLTFNINDLHIYDRHIPHLVKQISLEKYSAPELKINPEIKNFYDFKIDDFELINYQHGPKINMEVAI